MSAEFSFPRKDDQSPGPRACWIGVGSPHGDDRVGWDVTDRIRSRVTLGAETVPAVAFVKLASPVDLLDLADRPFRRWLICDAFAGPGPVGRLRHWRWPADELDDVCFTGSHDVSLAASLTLAGNLGRLPPRVDIWGIDIGPQPDDGPPPANPRDGTTHDGTTHDGTLRLGSDLAARLGPIVERLVTVCRDA